MSIFYMIFVPKGINANLASLNCCKPKGIPIIDMQRAIPNIRCSIARGKPENMNQRIFRKKEPAPPPYRTSFPKGKKLNEANLKHCIPIGMPMIVIHQRIPAAIQLRPQIAPPKMNQHRFPKKLITSSPCLISIS